MKVKYPNFPLRALINRSRGQFCIFAFPYRTYKFTMKFAAIDAQCASYNQLRLEDIAKLDEWQRKEPHLPAPLHPIETALFLHRSGYSIESAKQRIDMYYTFRSHCPEFFDKRDPFDDRVQSALDTCLMIALPELTPEGYLVIYCRLLDRNPEKYDYNALIKIMLMNIELLQKQHGCHAGVVVIVDLEGFTVSHVLKIIILSAQKCLLYLQKMLPLRFKSLHFVNGVPFMDMILALVRPFLKKRFPLKVHFGDNATICNFVPKDILPIQCGGTTFNAIEYYRNVARNNIESNSNYFKREAGQRVDETKRADKRINIDNLLGISGTFKKLNVD